MTEVLKAGVLSDEIDLGVLAHNAAEQAEEFVRKVIEFFIFQVYLIKIKKKTKTLFYLKIEFKKKSKILH